MILLDKDAGLKLHRVKWSRFPIWTICCLIRLGLLVET